MNKLVKYIVESRFNFNIDLLEDIDDEEDFSLSKQLYKSKSMKLEYLENAYFVDLGLPSGTKWCKYNLGCDFEKLNSNPESTLLEDWYGKYYAWGETKDKNYYSSGSYEYAKDSMIALTKYCTKSEYGYKKFKDNLVELLPEDDAAYQYDSNWKIPTKELFDELLKYTNNDWISVYMGYMGVKNLTGKLFTSKINGNQIFIPAAGRMSEYSLNNHVNYCYLWSSSLNTDNPSYAWQLFFSGFYTNRSNMLGGDRDYGQSIRPVLNKNN